MYRLMVERYPDSVPRSAALLEQRERCSLTVVDPATPSASLAHEVRMGLTIQPRQLPCRFFYDEAGSQLFEEICLLPEYYVTRAEREILLARADEMMACVAPETTLVELGSGSA